MPFLIYYCFALGLAFGIEAFEKWRGGLGLYRALQLSGAGAGNAWLLRGIWAFVAFFSPVLLILRLPKYLKGKVKNNG